MKYLIYLISIIILFGINTGLFPHFKIAGAGPNLLLLFVVLVALQKEPEIYFVAMVSGLFLDFSTGIFVGSFTLAFLLLALLANILLDRILVLEVTWRHVVGSTIGAIVFTDALIWGYNMLAFRLGWAQFGLDAQFLTRRIVPELAYNLLLLFPMYLSVSWLHRFLESQDRKKVHHG